MKMAAKLGSAVAASAFTLVLAGTSPSAAMAAPATTTAMTAAVPAAAQAVTAGPRPSVRWLCGKRIVKRLVPACTHGKWELPTVKKMRCLSGHGPYVGWTGPAKLSWWLHKCFETEEWTKW
ncbi:hypothetical protein [Nonomuraea rhodomycinica]|uniref:Secreted protein n=1 Tax=Nonomuraea rhodomycinica TaxID=1712872 RepID=A0A7Y6MEE1_9ACTN|nr:hypothetical protein [Nonomuraea rhodomycinica]NUW43895.1 hypothetical protein [Nonomuraea rhodomycinica]